MTTLRRRLIEDRQAVSFRGPQIRYGLVCSFLLVTLR